MMTWLAPTAHHAALYDAEKEEGLVVGPDYERVLVYFFYFSNETRILCALHLFAHEIFNVSQYYGLLYNLSPLKPPKL
jgi:hypothetical protein